MRFEVYQCGLYDPSEGTKALVSLDPVKQEIVIHTERSHIQWKGGMVVSNPDFNTAFTAVQGQTSDGGFTHI